MLRGAIQRAAVAIPLMVCLLAPLATCLPRTHKTAHSCCAPSPQSNSTAQTDCCTARAPLPAILVAPQVSTPAPMTVAQQFLSSKERSAPSELPALAVVPPQSPPPGASILRI